MLSHFPDLACIWFVWQKVEWERVEWGREARIDLRFLLSPYQSVMLYDEITGVIRAWVLSANSMEQLLETNSLFCSSGNKSRELKWYVSGWVGSRTWISWFLAQNSLSYIFYADVINFHKIKFSRILVMNND